MSHLSPGFGEEFHLATDDEVLAVDFWSYLNARQARLPLAADTQPLWDFIEELEQDLEPLLDERTALSHREFLTSASREWSDEDGPPALRAEVRREAGAMLTEALTPSPRRNDAQPS
jgi:hypothetical protein